jgi:Asp-tRNA(Asn)/Glu-tRNA(Gln) amidotransferase A subunit family amidase
VSRTLPGIALNHLSAAGIVRAIDAGEATAEAVTRACLDRIAERDDDVGAFEYLDAAYALEQARVLDSLTTRGPLHGVPVGIKDCFETFDMPTGWGSEIYAGRNTGRDAALVSLLRRAGAVILGKTVTSEFVAFHPGKTRNPHDLSRETGVSSMGSAAGVADFMFPVGIGTQTGSSIVRPAAHCGVIGYKASHGELPTDGLMAFAPAFDTAGFMVRDPEDIELVRRATIGADPAPARPADAPVRVALVRTRHWHEAEPAARDAVEAAAARLRAAGAVVDESPVLPESFDSLTQIHKIIQGWEGVHWRAYEYEHHRDEISDGLISFLDWGASLTHGDYVAAREVAESARRGFDALFVDHDVVLTPSAVGEPLPVDRPTGDAMFNRTWSLLRTPCLNLPFGRGPQGLPVGIQFVGRMHRDAQFLADVRWIAARLSD